jgi:hypothetical protein
MMSVCAVAIGYLTVSNVFTALRLLPADQIARLNIRRHQRLGGIFHEYQHAA